MYEVLIAHLRECAKLDPSNNTYAEAADAIDELLHIHQLDLSELVRLRRQIQALMEESEAPNA